VSVQVRPYDRSGNRLAPTTLPAGLPWSKCERVITFNAEGSINTDVPASLIDALALGPEVYLRIAVDGVEQSDWYMLDDDGDDPAAAEGTARPITTGGRGVMAVLDWAQVYPQGYTPGGAIAGLDMIYEFANATPGKIMYDLITAAKARGCFPQLTMNFTATTDSSGAAWPQDKLYSLTYQVGTTLLTVLHNMLDAGWCDAEMVGFQLNLYAPNTALAGDHPQTVVRLGREVQQAPRQRTRRAIVSAMLGGGDEGALVEVVDNTALALYGRREGYEGRGGITDIGVLTSVTQTSLGRQTDVSETITVALDPATAPALPRPGHYIRYDQRRLSSTQLEPMRIQSIAWAYGDSPTLSVELNDLWMDRDVLLKRRLDALTNGSGSNERVPTAAPPVTNDGIAPKAPSGITVTPFIYYPTRYSTIQGLAPQAAASLTWPPVSQNSDNSPFNDFGHYAISVLEVDRPGATWSADRSSQTNAAQWSGFTFAENVQFRVAAVDQDGNRSAWTYSATTPLTAAAGAIPQPSDPAVTTRLGQVFVHWDGLTHAGIVPDRWIVGVEVHTSTDPAFVPNDATKRDVLGSIGDSVIPGLSLGTQQYVRLVCIDFNGTRGLASAAIGVTPTALVTADMLDGAVGSAKLADLAVTTAKIADLSINDAKIVSVDAGKITTGTLFADVLLSGSIQTASGGARVALKSDGFTAYNSTGSVTVRIDTAGNASFAGTITAAQITGYLRSVGSGGTQVTMRPDAIQTPDAGLAPGLTFTTGISGETAGGSLHSYSEVYSGTKRWMHTMMRSPTVSGAGYSFVRASIVGQPGGYSAPTYVPSEVALGFGDGSTIVAVHNMTSTHDATTSSPGWSFRGNGTSAGLRSLNNNLDVVNVDGSAWATVRASAFTVQSGSAVKEGIRPADDVDAVAVIRDNPAMLWRYLPEFATDGRLRLGPLADGLPDFVRQVDDEGRHWLDQASVGGLLWRAVGQLAERAARLPA
jgi:hypothetical protein